MVCTQMVAYQRIAYHMVANHTVALFVRWSELSQFDVQLTELTG